MLKILKLQNIDRNVVNYVHTQIEVSTPIGYTPKKKKFAWQSISHQINCVLRTILAQLKYDSSGVR